MEVQLKDWGRFFYDETSSMCYFFIVVLFILLDILPFWNNDKIRIRHNFLITMARFLTIFNG